MLKVGDFVSFNCCDNKLKGRGKIIEFFNKNKVIVFDCNSSCYYWIFCNEIVRPILCA